MRRPITYFVLFVAIVVGAIATAGARYDVKWVFLWTDVLVYLLIVSIVSFGLYAVKRPHIREPWQHVWRSRVGMASLVILLAYVAVGLVDSVHFRLPAPNDDGKATVTQYSGEVLSGLDVILMPLRKADEKTYSAPFAAYQFTKETVEHPDGSRSRDYPRLRAGGAHLQDPQQDRVADIARSAALGFSLGVIIWLALSALLLWWLARCWHQSWAASVKSVIRRQSEVPWHVVLITSGLVIITVATAAWLAKDYHIFGTDKVGEDVFYQSLKSVRTGLVIGTLTTLIMLPFAVLLGIMAGYFKGWVDDVIQYLYTTLNSIPSVLLIAAAILMLQVYLANHPEMFETDEQRSDMRLFFLCVILGITSWTGLCRMLRGETMKLAELDFIQASRAFGVSHAKTIMRHILPNVLHIVLISVVLDFSGLVLAEAVLSYVGVGVDPTMQSWGNMINGARLEMAREPIVWWSLAAAFMFMFVLVLAANLFSDVVRDAFDPRMRKQ